MTRTRSCGLLELESCSKGSQIRRNSIGRKDAAPTASGMRFLGMQPTKHNVGSFDLGVFVLCALIEYCHLDDMRLHLWRE